MSDSFATCPPLVVNFDNKSTGAAKYNWSFGNNSTSVLDTPATVYTYPGTYTVKLIALTANGCKDSATKTVTILGPTGTFSYNVAGCSPLTVNFSANAKNTVAYIWDMNNGVTKTTSTSSTSYTYLQSGKYVPKLILSDGGSCLVPIQGKDTIMADSVSADFSFNTQGVLCQSGTVQFIDTIYHSIQSITSRSWSFGDGGTSTAHNPSHRYTAPGTYTVRLIVGNTVSCKDTIVKTVVVHPNPTVSTGNSIAVCASSSTPVTLQASGANKYSWVPSTGLSCDTCTNPSIIPLGSGTYTVIGIDSNGCKDTATVSITVRAKPSITAGANQSICEGSSVTLQAAGGSTYTWSPATGLSCTNCPNPIATPAATTTYIVTGIDSNGCSNTDTVTVTVNAKPVVSAGTDNKLCLGSNVQLHASGAATYQWSPATGLSCTTCANPTATPGATTTYTLIGTTTNGCSDTDEVTVVVNPLPVISVADDTICAGSSVTMAATGATTYDWSPSTGLSCNNCASTVASPSATTTYTITGTDVNGCIASTQATITVNPLPAVDAGTDTAICEGVSAQLQATGATTYIWSPDSTLSCTTCANPIAAPATTTTYVVTGMTNGCSKTDTVTVTVLPKPEVTAGPDVAICEGASVSLHASGAATYNWLPAAGLPCSSCPVLTVNPSSTTNYILTGIDSNGCATSTGVTVIVNPLPKVDAGADQEICEKGSVLLKATGADRYVWSPAEGLSCTKCDDPTASPVTNIIYKVKGIDEKGCSDSDEVEITIIHKTATSVGAGDTLCKGEAAQLTASGGTSYLWLPAAGLSDNKVDNPTAMPSATTTYQLQVKQGTCFVDTYSVTVLVQDHPMINAGEDIHTAAGSETKIKTLSTGATKFEWFPATNLSCSDCESPIAKPNVTTTYKVLAYSELGCKSEDEITIYTSCGQDQIFVANTFTPNGDGNNDYFFPQGKGISEAKRFRVFNRWGELLFDRQNMPLNNELAGWDGTYKGQQLKPDVFVYILNAVCESGEPIEMKGDISLIR
jgi:gliding motility-associated-like protein